MRRHLVGSAELWVVATLVAIGVYIRGGIPDEDLYRAYILFVCAILVFLFIQLSRHSGDPRVERPRQGRSVGPPGLPQELTTVADALRAGSASRPDFDRSVRPLLREIVTDRLMAAGVDPRRDPERARQLLGAEEAALALTEGPSHARLQDRGPTPSEITRLLDRLEAASP